MFGLDAKVAFTVQETKTTMSNIYVGMMEICIDEFNKHGFIFDDFFFFFLQTVFVDITVT